jgi:hypothetical protein
VKKVCLFDFPECDNFYGHEIRSFRWEKYFIEDESRAFFRFKKLWQQAKKRKAVTRAAEGMDSLYRARDSEYMAIVSAFVDTFKDYDLIVMAQANPIHPEVFSRKLTKPIKILGFIDDPYSTYLRGIPYLWAFDGAFYASQSYSQVELFSEALPKWGCKATYWWPLCPINLELPKEANDDFFNNRTRDLVYVGLPVASKTDRLIRMRKVYGNRFSIYGRWPFGGYSGIVRGLLGRKVLWKKVESISIKTKKEIYWQTKVGFNMHMSVEPTETGNMRMYEVPAHGMLLVCDKAGRDAHELIFSSEEAVYYDSIPEAITTINYYLRNDEERVEIAKRGYQRFLKDYLYEANLNEFLTWAFKVSKK